MARKKKLEEDAWLWMSQPYLPASTSTTPYLFLSPSPTWNIQPPPMPGTSFIDNYLLYFFLLTPFEQIGTFLDPFGIQVPPQRYLDNPLLLPFDLHEDAQLMKSTFVPGPYKVHGWPPEGYVEGAGYSTWDPDTGTVV